MDATLLLQCCALRIIWKVKICTIRLQEIECPNVCDQIVFYSFHSFLVQEQMSAGYIHVPHICNSNQKIRKLRIRLV